MAQGLTDHTGAPVTVRLELDGPISAYTVRVDDGPPVGRAEFVDSPDTAAERIFFHTEVDGEFGGRGLARLLVREALEDSRRRKLTVVPVCPVFARHLRRHGDEYVASGGVFRRATRDDLALIARTTRG
ncbi:GNAT family N-acetyltransferase [Streptomyces sedi]|uniref:N-acetyltransferase n=1 Tax=Streptomyces sedi TaxID=555059 RepID=A0A5C4VF43_9ACTN|nr:GNAT family N-acetyltransferase [Streptomyces sedi]TNM34392.1 N-acetyltransferase [Streptomyces sedi]